MPRTRPESGRVRGGLQRRDESVKAERDHPGADPEQATVFPHSLPNHQAPRLPNQQGPPISASAATRNNTTDRTMIMGEPTYHALLHRHLSIRMALWEDNRVRDLYAHRLALVPVGVTALTELGVPRPAMAGR